MLMGRSLLSAWKVPLLIVIPIGSGTLVAAELVAFPQLPSDPYLWGLLLEITFSQLSTNSGIAIFFF